MKHLKSISKKVLSNQLNELMADQIVSKREYLTGKVKHTEYQLTDIGETLIPIIVALNDWGENRLTGSGAKFTQGECILYHELKLEVFR